LGCDDKHEGKAFRFVLICLLAGLLTAVLLIGKGSPVSGDSAPDRSENAIYSKEQISSAQTDPPVEITVSALGDCTLGYDYRYPVLGRFDTVIKSVNYDYGYCFSKVMPIISQDDLTIANLETTLTRNNQRIAKGSGRAFWFRGDPAYVQILKKGSVEAAFFANNHGYDYGYAGFKDTLNYLDQAGIIAFGYERKINTRIKGIDVALLGYNLVDSIENGVKVEGVKARIAQDIRTVRENNGADLVIVNCHWGIEGNRKAHWWQVAVAHGAIDSGADLVLGHHPHVIQGVEIYQGKMIVYSLGNFCFGGNSNPSDKDTFIFQQTFPFDGGGQCTDFSRAQVIPCLVSSSISRNNYCPAPADENSAARIHSRTGY